MEITINTDKTVYFTSDHHFGAPTKEKSLPREQLFLQWLNEKEQDMGALFILGDLFDFWFEYKTVVPKGFVRILGKLAQLKDKGIPIYFFVGNASNLISKISNEFKESSSKQSKKQFNSSIFLHALITAGCSL